MKLISVMGFFCEILEENLLKVMISHVSSQILEICDFLNDEEIFIEFLNFFHITTEFSKETRLLLMKFPDENSAFFTKMKEIFIKPFNEPVNFSLFLAKAFILGIFFNFFQENACFSAEILKEMLFFTEFALNSKIIEEFANFEVFAKEKINVIGVQTQSVKGTAWMTFTVEVADSGRLAKVLGIVAELNGVRAARRR